MFPVKDVDNGKIKYVARSKGKVVDNRDPLKKGRIKVDHPISPSDIWIPYLRKPSEFDVPSIGDVVYIEADAGFPTHCFAWGNTVRGIDSAPKIPEKFKRDVPTNRGLETPGGHSLEFDDGIHAPVDTAPVDTDFTTENRGIRITSTAGNKIHIIEDEAAAQQYILLSTANGNLIKLDYKDNKLSINVLDTTQFDTAGDRDDTVGGDFSITVTGDVTIDCTNATVNTSADAIIDATGDASVIAGGTALVMAGGDVEVEAGGSINLKSSSNTLNGGVVTDNPANNDPITGLPLTGAGGVNTL